MRPAGDTRFDAMPFAVIRDRLVEPGDKFRPLGPRPDKTHIALEHVEDLCQFVQAQAANAPPDPGHTAVIRSRPARTAVGLGVLAHAPELEEMKHLPIQPDPTLAIDNLAARTVLEQNRERYHQHQWPGQQDDHRAGDQVQRPAAKLPPQRFAETTGQNQPARVQHLQRDPARLAFEETDQLDDLDALQTAI